MQARTKRKIMAHKTLMAKHKKKNHPKKKFNKIQMLNQSSNLKRPILKMEIKKANQKKKARKPLRKKMMKSSQVIKWKLKQPKARNPPKNKKVTI